MREHNRKKLMSWVEYYTYLHVNLLKFLSRAGSEAVIQELTGCDREYTGAKIDIPATGNEEPVLSERQGEDCAQNWTETPIGPVVIHAESEWNK